MEELRGLAQDHSVTQEKKKGLNREQFTQKFGARIGREGKHDVANVFTTLDSGTIQPQPPAMSVACAPSSCGRGV
jgi:hypothetical protein|eukprot:SAG25_NODE_430_length_8134_cov_59.362290_2_plen_75_part_00